ncbi:unnamed protein product [Blepharisma stoltei]|uniref:EamA domain-containing protein n=1 Tax=Blepharisma stoltei TaxID=1481888 RepID=A0AAU9I9S4_9CILI|nr:unnamed protein product [Blepharisma stoltei]
MHLSHQIQIYLFMLVMLISGTANTLITKAMDNQSFTHPFFQSATMFFGEMLCLAIYYLILWKNRGNEWIAEENLMTAHTPTSKQGWLYQKFGPYIFFIPALFDILASCCFFIGLLLSTPSIYQMARGSVIAIVAVYSIIFLNRKLYRHEVTGIISIALGVILTGLVSYLYQEQPQHAYGVAILVVGEFFTGALFVSEEMIMRKVQIDPLRAIGIEGHFGLMYWLILMPILYFIPCHKEEHVNLCPDRNNAEDPIQAFHQLGSNWDLMLLWLFYTICVAAYNWSGISTTKYATAIARTTITLSRMAFVWVFSIIFGFEEPFLLEIVGFVMIVLGTLLYNEVLIVPWFGFKDAAQRRKNEMDFTNKVDSKTITNVDDLERFTDLKLGSDSDTDT